MKRRFGQRLRRAWRQAEASAERLGGPSGEFRRSLLERQARVDRDRVPVELPPGEICSNEQGSCYLRQLRYRVDHQHGSLALQAALGVDRQRLAELARQPGVDALDLTRCLFLDTETTGLAGGAGTVVFMTGLGFFAGDEFVLEQTFMRSYAEEPAALWHVKQRLIEYPHLVTFVGKAFDRHRLSARMAVHRLRSRILTSQHLDLYYMARRAWKDELDNVRLQTVERCKLGVHRADDLPGAEAPVAFMDWIRDGSGQVDAVFEHNRLDVLSLVTLLAALGRPSPTT